MNTDAYFRRIGYDGPLAPTHETLRNLHLAHLMTVPLENLDISLGCPITLDEDHFFTKIVERGRGGLCYELNGLFAALLTSLGFSVTLLSARVCDGKIIAEFDHLALRVDLPDSSESWLADVGFGDGFLEPLRLTEDIKQAQGVEVYCLTRDAHRWFNARRHSDEWNLLYDFTLQPRELREFTDMCQYHQTSSDSAFTKRRICTRATPTGRVTLAGTSLIQQNNGVRKELLLNSDEDFRAALFTHFKILL